MKIQEYLKKEFHFTFNYYHLMFLIMLYFFGLYGIGSIEPIWQNLDGMAFFWIYQVSFMLTILTICALLYKTSKIDINNKIFRASFNFSHLLTFLGFFCFLVLTNYKSIGNDLAEDETSYAGYSVHHIDKILFDLNSSLLNDVEIASIYRISLLLFFLLVLFIVKKLGLLGWKNKVIAYGSLLLILRFINQFYFKLNVYSLPYTDPLFLIHQFGIILFGFTSTGFRLSTVAFFAFFMMCTKILLEKYFYFSQFKSIISTLCIVSLPIVLSMSTKIDHGQFSYFSQVFMWIYILNSSRIPVKYVAPFLVSSVYFSLTSINILLSGLVYLFTSNERRNVLVTHLKVEWRVYIFLLPIITISILKSIKDWHLRPLITGYTFIPYDERIATLLKTLPNAVGSLYVLAVTVTILYLIYNRIINVLFLTIYFSVTFAIYTFFIVPTALNHNRYSFQLISSLLVIAVVHFMAQKNSFRRLRSSSLVFVILCNITVFTFFQRNYDQFDQYVKDNRWNYSINGTNQPVNVIWPSTAYSHALRMGMNSNENMRACVLLGLYYKAVPYALSGSDLGYMRTIEKISSLPAHRSYLNDFNNYSPGDNWTFHSEVECVIISNMYYKKEFIDFLLTQNWIINNSYESNNGIRVFTLQKNY